MTNANAAQMEGRDFQRERTESMASRPQGPAKTGLGTRVNSVGALYAQALLIEEEAVARYREFASKVADCGNDAVAGLFGRLAEFEAEHAFGLAKKAVGMELPKLSLGEYAWLDRGAPNPEAHAFVYRLMTPRHALEIALRAELRAKAFFEDMLAESSDEQTREAATELAREEDSHIAWVKEALAHVPRPFRPTEELPGDPTIPQQL